MRFPTLFVFVVWAMLTGKSIAQTSTNFPSHPRLLFTRADLPAIKERIAKHAWAKTGFESLKRQADDWLKRDVKLPPRGGQWSHYYCCPKHGARLRTEGPTRHVCPIDKEVFSGFPYDDVVLSSEHHDLARGLRTLGIVYQLTGDDRYAEKAKEILLAYAAKYESYPLHNTRGEAKTGGGKVGPQTLDESTWLIAMVEGADCIWDTLAADEQKNVADHLLYPATDVIRKHRMRIHNIQCWKNSAVGLTGLLLGDMKLVDEALKGDSGYFNQMAKGVSPDGAWYEGAWGYHFYTVSAVHHLTEGAFHCGINLYGDAFKGMFDAPLKFAMPDLSLPAFNDSRTVSVAGQAALYETAFARYKDDRYRLVLAPSRRDSLQALFHGAADVSTEAAPAPASSNHPASGYAILSSGNANEAAWFCIDYGPHGGGHGHPDKLGFVLYGRGQIIAPDPGTTNYGVPLQAGWYRTTIAHNTLTVDEESQKPAEGKHEAFIATNGFSAVMAAAGQIYDGVTFYRTAALIGDNVLVFIDQIRADKPHTFDLAYHNDGKLTPLADARPFEIPNKPGYSYIRAAKSINTARAVDLTFELDKAGQVRWIMAEGEPTTYITGTGVGRHTEDRVPLVIARLKGTKAVYRWCVTRGAPAAVDQLKPEPVTLVDGMIPSSSEVAAVRVTTTTGTHIIVANPQAQPIIVAGLPVDSKIVHLVQTASDKFETRHAAR